MMLDTDDRRKIIGNAIIASAETEEVLLEELRKDVYARGGVWDMDRVGLGNVRLVQQRLITKAD